MNDETTVREFALAVRHRMATLVNDRQQITPRDLAQVLCAVLDVLVLVAGRQGCDLDATAADVLVTLGAEREP